MIVQIKVKIYVDILFLFVLLIFLKVALEIKGVINFIYMKAVIILFRIKIEQHSKENEDVKINSLGKNPKKGGMPKKFIKIMENIIWV